MIRFRNEGDEWQWLRRWTDRGTFTAEGWISFFFVKRIMNRLTTAGIHFQLWILVLKKTLQCFYIRVSSVANMWKVFKTLWNLTVTNDNGYLCQQHAITLEGWKCSPRSEVQPTHTTDTPPLYSLPNAIKVTSKAVLWPLNMFRFRKTEESVQTCNMTQRVKGL